MGSASMTVAHHVDTYLKPSENWIYHQVRHVKHFRSIFLADELLDPERYPWDPVYSGRDLAPLRRGWSGAVRRLFGYDPHFAEVCRREGVRLVHAHHGLSGTRALHLAHRLDVPLVTSFYGRDIYFHRSGDDGLRRRYRSLFAEGSRFIAEGPAARAQLIRIGCPPERIHLHRMGIDPSAIAYLPRTLEPGSPLKVLMAARPVEKKGMRYGVEAFCRAARDEPRLRLTVVGTAGDSPRESRALAPLRALVTRYAMEDRVDFVGFLPNAALHQLAREHHLFLHPSVRARDGDAEGGHPVVLPEMAAAGMPIVSSRHCDIPEVVIDGETGWLCDEGDVAALEAALREAVNRPERLAELGSAGRRLIESKYDIRQQTLDRIYETLLP